MPMNQQKNRLSLGTASSRQRIIPTEDHAQHEPSNVGRSQRLHATSRSRHYQWLSETSVLTFRQDSIPTATRHVRPRTFGREGLAGPPAVFVGLTKNRREILGMEVVRAHDTVVCGRTAFVPTESTISLGSASAPSRVNKVVRYPNRFDMILSLGALSGRLRAAPRADSTSRFCEATGFFGMVSICCATSLARRSASSLDSSSCILSVRSRKAFRENAESIIASEFVGSRYLDESSP
jgi:hypothetical protein